MTSVRFQRLLPVAGILAGLLLAVGLVVTSGKPSDDASTAEILDYWRDHETAYLVLSIGLVPLATILLILFGVGLRAALRSREAGEGSFSALAFAGTIVAAVSFGLVGAQEASLVNAAQEGSGDAVYALHQLDAYHWIPWVIGFGAMLIGAGLGGLRTLLLPRWLAWVTLVMGVLLLTPVGFAPFLLLPLWLVVTGGVLLARDRDTARQGTGASATPAGV
jgi:hypothetical protein